MTLRDNIIRLIDDLDLDADHWSDDMIDHAETLCAEHNVSTDVWHTDDIRVATYCIVRACNDSRDDCAQISLAHEYVLVNPQNTAVTTPLYRRTSCGGWAQIVDRAPAVGDSVSYGDREDWLVAAVTRVTSTYTPLGEDVTVYRVRVVCPTCDTTEYWATVEDADDDDEE